MSDYCNVDKGEVSSFRRFIELLESTDDVGVVESGSTYIVGEVVSGRGPRGKRIIGVHTAVFVSSSMSGAYESFSENGDQLHIRCGTYSAGIRLVCTNKVSKETSVYWVLTSLAELSSRYNLAPPDITSSRDILKFINWLAVRSDMKCPMVIVKVVDGLGVSRYGGITNL